ncbi:hypothetical protein CLV90_1064 [Maribacter spongiicola]|uniref:Uncharacterized protein n=1 Tax=Maribacter spongiicola TaxID=1206753 RepID=A0A4R7K6T9_9FLAO|nr:hypothetical protein [Maribacter spongiicola]TDT46997.1 hypothetical protein CLV90_1064 [Maribacter spongiicola]
MNQNPELLNQIRDLTREYDWINIRLELNFTITGGYGLKSSYLSESGKYETLPISLRLLRPHLKEIIDRFTDTKNTDTQFNQVVLSIDKDFNLKTDYLFNQEFIQVQKINNSKVFYQWLNETMMNRIFEFEKENNLLKPVYDDHGEFDYYESSYDNGVFSFLIKENKVSHNLELIKNGASRDLNMPLPDYVNNGILEHHQITNTELKKEWKPWNKLTIKSPHNDIPFDKCREYVKYSMEKTKANKV